MGEQDYTAGDYPNEDASCVAFDDIVGRSGLFRIYTKPEGFYLQPRLGVPLKHPEIDRLLVPTRTLINRGWDHGALGIEVKRSGMKIGKPLNQLLDYSRAVWKMPGRLWLMCEWYFLWPCPYQFGPLGSIQAQQRVGGAEPDRWGGVIFSTSVMPVLLHIHADGSVDIGPGLNGRKVGSR